MTPALLARLAAFYTALTAVMGWPLLLSIGTRIAADAGDPLLNASILTWNAIALPWSDAWYQIPIFYPSSDALTFSEHLLGGSVIATPIYWLTGNSVLAYNLTLLLSYPLSALAMCLLVWRLTRNHTAAFLSGLAFGFAPYRAAQLPHLQVLIVFWAPLALLGLHGYFETRRWWWLALFGVCWTLQGAANGYFLVFFSVLIGLWILWFGVAARRWREVTAVMAALMVAALPHLPILYRYWIAHDRYGFFRSMEEIQFFSAQMTAPGCPAAGLTVWGWLGGNCGAEGELFAGPVLVALCAAGIGFIVSRVPRTREARLDLLLKYVSRASMLLAIPFIAGGVAFVASGRWRFSVGPIEVSASSAAKPFTSGALLLLAGILSSRVIRTLVRHHRLEAFYLIAAIVMWMLTWGPAPRVGSVQVLTQGPYAWLYHLPGLDGFRVPARFWMMTVISLSVLMGLVLARWLQHRPRRWVVPLAAIMAVGLLADGWIPIRGAAIPAPPPAPELLRGQTVMTLPIGRDDFTTGYRAVAGGWTSVNGASGYEPANYNLLRVASAMETDDLFSPFVTEGDLHIVVAQDAPRLISLVERQPGVRETARDASWRQYLLPFRYDPLLLKARGASQPITAISASCEEDRIPFMRDGDLATRWHCGPQTRDQEIRIDLGSVMAVGAVVTALGQFLQDAPRHLAIGTSADGDTWQEAWDGPVERATGAAAFRDLKRVPLTVSFAPRQARYVRLRQTGRDETWYWSIAELEVWSGLAEPGR